MSRAIEGKISGQPLKRNINNEAKCECCNKVIPTLRSDYLTMVSAVQIIYNCFGTPYYIYESNSGYSIVYCSDKCRRKHNHRFNPMAKKESSQQYIDFIDAYLHFHIIQLQLLRVTSESEYEVVDMDFMGLGKLMRKKD